MEEMYMDIPRIYTALAEWSACMVYFSILPKRTEGVKKYLLCIGMLILQSIYFVYTGELNTVFWIPCMIGAGVIMYGFHYGSLKINVLSACFISAKAFLLAEFTASLEWQIHVFLFEKEKQRYQWNELLFMAIFYFLIFFLFYSLGKKRKTEEYIESISKKECLLAIGIVLISFSVSNLSFVFSNTPFTSGIQEDVFTIRTLVDMCGITVMFVLQSQMQELIAEKEVTAIHAALIIQYEQYRNYQDSFEMMNMKYHDIKHQIAGMRAEENAGKRNVWLDEMEKELDVFSDIGHTGSNVLDGILAGKGMYCKKQNIKITCVADGNILQDIHVTDLCTIFGNALDNAIESVSMVSDIKKRLIHFSVSKQKNFIFIQFENYSENELHIGKNQMPATSKANKKEHGYGMRSINLSVEKYNGSMTYSLKENWFELKILIPYKGS